MFSALQVPSHRGGLCWYAKRKFILPIPHQFLHNSFIICSLDNKLLTWADLYDQSTFEAKKMIAAQLIKFVHVGWDYNIEIIFDVSFQEFQQAKLSGENHTKTPSCSHPA